MRSLNLGCGSRFHTDWENVDFVSASPNVKAFDLRKGIPYPDATFDVVYHSHLLEHLNKRFAPVFLQQCRRVLKPGGVIRVAVPDLEKIARTYLESLEKASRELPGWDANYEWIVLEMYDQTVREKSCGECAEYFRRAPIPNWDFVFSRWGTQANILLDAVRNADNQSDGGTAWRYVFKNPGAVLRNKIVKTLLGPSEWEALQAGRFRRGGEIHMWMYDAYSLGKLLKEAGFIDIRQQSATESRIPDWQNYHLDSEPDGSTYKPDSLYMEGIRA
jgi:SAM-dependent methyltransferase